MKIALAQINPTIGDLDNNRRIILDYAPTTEEPLLWMQLLGVRHTGDFESEPEEAVALYKKLSKGRGLRPPAVGFIFDREDRSEEELEDIGRRDDRIQFTERRMYENYLLNSDAIAELLAELDRDGEQYTTEQIREWMEAHGDEFDTDHEYATDEWYQDVHAANLLEELFIDLSDARVSFDKVRHTPLLTERILDHSPGDLQGIAEFLTATLEKGREMQNEGELTA